MDPNKYFSGYKNAGRKQKFGYAKKCAIWTGNFCIFTVEKEVGKRPVSRWFGFGRKRIYREKNEAIRIALKHNNSLETFPYLTRKHLAMHQSDFTLQIPS